MKMTIVTLLSLVSIYSSATYAKTYALNCQAKMHGEIPSYSHPIEESFRLEKTTKSHGQFIQLMATKNMFDPEVTFLAELNNSSSRAAAKMLITFDDKMGHVKTNRLDIHHTQMKAGKKFELTLIPDNYSNRHFVELTCTTLQK